MTERDHAYGVQLKLNAESLRLVVPGSETAAGHRSAASVLAEVRHTVSPVVADAGVRRGLGGFAASSGGLVADRIKIGQAWSVDIRVKSFVPEAAGRLDFLCAEYGFTGPEVAPDEAGVYPLLRRVRYERLGCAIEISLVLSYMGEEYVATVLVSEDGSGSVRRTQIGSGAAHNGYQMRRALDRQAETVRHHLRDESSRAGRRKES